MPEHPLVFTSWVSRHWAHKVAPQHGLTREMSQATLRVAEEPAKPVTHAAVDDANERHADVYESLVEMLDQLAARLPKSDYPVGHLVESKAHRHSGTGSTRCGRNLAIHGAWLHKALIMGKNLIDVIEGDLRHLPGASALVGAIRALIDLELHRRANNEHIAFVKLTLFHSIYVMREVVPIVKGGDASAAFANALEEHVMIIQNDIHEWVAFVDWYHKQGKLVHLLHAHINKESFNSFKNTFVQYNYGLESLVRIELARTSSQKLNQTLAKLEMHSKNAKERADTVVLHAIDMSSKEVQTGLAYVNSMGGTQTVLNNDKLLHGLAKEVKERLTLEVTVMIRQDPSTVLKDKKTLYRTKFQEMREAKELEDMLHQVVPEDSYKLILHPEMDELWKENGWKMSVKCRTFLDALHEYYVRRPKQKNTENSATPAPLDARNNESKWMLDILAKPICQMALGDVIDKDGSGFISVSELNAFIRRCSTEWKLQAWFVFWACGWHHMNIKYYSEIYTLLESMEHTAKNLGPHVRQQKPVIKLLAALRVCIETSGVDEDTHVVHHPRELDILETQYHEKERNRFREYFKKYSYHLKDRADLHCLLRVTRQTCIEVPFACIVVELLKNFSALIARMNDGKTDEDYDHALLDVGQSFCVVFESVWNRMNELTQGWKAQSRGVGVQAERYCYGFFSQWYLERTKTPNEQVLLGLYEWLEHFKKHDDDDQHHLEMDIDSLEHVVQEVVDLSARVDQLKEKLGRMTGMNGVHVQTLRPRQYRLQTAIS